MKWIIALMVLLGIGSACVSMNSTDVINTSYTMDPNETCFFFEDLNFTLTHNSTTLNVTEITYNITENITIIDNCSHSFLDVSLSPGDSWSEDLRNLTVSCSGESAVCNFTVEDCVVCEDCDYSLDPLILSLNPGESGEIPSRNLSWVVANSTACSPIPVCEECISTECEEEVLLVETCAFPWANNEVYLDPGQSQVIHECKTEFHCQDPNSLSNLQLPQWLDGCDNPKWGWRCDDFMYANCTEDEQQRVAYDECTMRLREEDIELLEDCSEEKIEFDFLLNDPATGCLALKSLEETKVTNCQDGAWATASPWIGLVVIGMGAAVCVDYVLVKKPPSGKFAGGSGKKAKDHPIEKYRNGGK